MHPDLMLIEALWEVDRATDAIKTRARELKCAVDEAQVRIDAVVEAHAAVSAQEQLMSAKEAELQALLDRYIVRRDRAARLMEGGSALDYLVVQKQHEQCATKVDELEGEVMGCMEQIDAMQAQGVALLADQEAAKAHHQKVRAQWVQEGGEIRVELERLDADRFARWADFPRDLHSHYKDLRRRKRDVVVPIKDGNCSACQMTVNAQVSVDLRGSRRVHTCRGCGRYLTLPVDEEQAEA